MPPHDSSDGYSEALVKWTGAVEGGGVAEPGFCSRNPGGKGGSPKPGGSGGSWVTSIRQVWRSPGDIFFQSSAFFRNSARSLGVISANFWKERMQARRCAGGSLSKARKVFSISCRSGSENAPSVLSFSLGGSSK